MLARSFLSGILIFSMPLVAEILVQDQDNKASSLSFNVTLQGEYFPEGRIFVTANEAVPGNTYALAAVRHNSTLFQGLTPETVTLDGKLSQANPLFGAAIVRAALLGSQWVVQTPKEPSSLFLVDDQSGGIAVYSASGIQDATKKRASQLLGLTTNATTLFAALEAQAQRSAFAAVANRNGRFDGDGSGIALLFFRRLEDKDKKSFFAWDIVDAVTGESQYSEDGSAKGTGNRAFPFGKDTSELFITRPVKTITALHDMHFDRELGILYLVVEAEGEAGENDGVRGLIMASCRNGKLQLQVIASESAFDGTSRIVGARGSSTSVALYKVRTLQTRTYLRYAIVVGGVGTQAGLNRQVHALPLVDNLASSSHGALASVKSLPATLFTEGKPGRFLTRVFTAPAEKPDDLFKPDDPAGKVGGDGILPGAISDIHIQGESVFVSVEQAEESFEPGIFYSQPLFDGEGRISGWTRWQRVAGTADSIRRFSYNPYTAAFTYLPVLLSSSTQTVLRTTFEGGQPLKSLVAHEFPQSLGGVQALFDFPVTTSSFSTALGKRLSVQAYCGFQKVVLLQTGRDYAALFGPLLSDPTVYTSTNGTLRGFNQQTALSLSGGALSRLGPLDACTVITDGTSGWFVVGGSAGVAVLADASGRGWDARTGLENGFRGLRQDMSWHLINEAAHVRKLIAYGNQLFILTDDQLIRLEVTSERIAGKRFTPVVLATTAEGRSFSDVIVSGPLALLATSFGLLRSGNLVDIQVAPDERSVHWTPVLLPESAGSLSVEGPASRFFAVTSTGDERDVSKGGTVWVLNGYVGLNQALLYRFVISLEKERVTDKTVQLYPDYFFSDKKTFFANSGEYRNYLMTDGALIALSRSAYGGKRPLLEQLPPLIKSGDMNGTRTRASLLTLPDDASSIGKLVRNSASGAWMVSGDFGVRIQG